MDKVNKQNLLADKNAYGRWAQVSEPFRSEESLRELYELFRSATPYLTEQLSIAEFGSAEGLVGEYFSERLSSQHRVTLSLFDIVPEHLAANKNPGTVKILVDLLDLDLPPTYHLGIMRSVLHYFSRECQVVALQNIRRTILSGGYIVVQAFVQYPENLPLYMKLNHMLGKDFQLVGREDVLGLLETVGFSQVSILGKLKTFQFSQASLQRRYNLSSDLLEEMRNLIATTEPEKRREFSVSKNDFSVPVPYEVFLARI